MCQVELAIYIYISNSKYIYERRGLRGQKTASDLLELEMQALVSLLLWMLRTELGASARAVYVFNL